MYLCMYVYVYTYASMSDRSIKLKHVIKDGPLFGSLLPVLTTMHLVHFLETSLVYFEVIWMTEEMHGDRIQLQ